MPFVKIEDLYFAERVAVAAASRENGAKYSRVATKTDCSDRLHQTLTYDLICRGLDFLGRSRGGDGRSSLRKNPPTVQDAERVFFFFSAGFSKRQDGRLGVRYAHLAFEVFADLAEPAVEAPHT
jgi:hypothetical protein